MRRQRTLIDWALYILAGCIILVLAQLLLHWIAS